MGDLVEVAEQLPAFRLNFLSVTFLLPIQLTLLRLALVLTDYQSLTDRQEEHLRII